MVSILITAGPTREYLDDVRFLSNGSSGRMGFALANQMANQPGGFLGTSGQVPATGPTAPLPDVLTPADVAKALGVTEADVLSTLESGELKGRKIGSAWRVTRAALDDFLKH